MREQIDDDFLDRVLIGGREQRPIVIVDPDPAWPARSAALAEQVRAALGADARVEHIGSTAVPGLAAKPIIDLVLVVADVDDESSYVPALEAAGFVLRVREPGHRMFRTPELDVHLHVSSAGDPAIDAWLDLRDWLSVDAADRERYAAVKRELAQRDWADMNFYAQAKDEIVASILAHAREWRAGTRRPTPGRP